MFDLQQSLNRVYELKWIDGSILRLHKPTRAMEVAFIDLKEKNLDEREMQRAFYNFVFRILERREPVMVYKEGFFNTVFGKTEELVITPEDIEKIPLEALFDLVKDYFEFHYKFMGE